MMVQAGFFCPGIPKSSVSLYLCVYFIKKSGDAMQGLEMPCVI